MEYEAKRPIHLPVLEVLQLELHLMETRPGVKLETFLTELMHWWLTKDTERQELRQRGPALRGFQWKNLFLPDGTVLRTHHGEGVEFAKVVGDRIVSDDGASLTPSEFANRRARGRNAWRFVWLRFPGHAEWVRAENCRASGGSAELKRCRATMERSKTVPNGVGSRSNTV